jgi:hypothetical protein
MMKTAEFQDGRGEEGKRATCQVKGGNGSGSGSGNGKWKRAGEIGHWDSGKRVILWLNTVRQKERERKKGKQEKERERERERNLVFVLLCLDHHHHLGHHRLLLLHLLHLLRPKTGVHFLSKLKRDLG